MALDAPPGAGTDLLRADLASYASRLWGHPVTVGAGPPPDGPRAVVWASTSEAAIAKTGEPPEDGYAMKRLDEDGRALFVVSARTPAALAHGVYAWLELLGARFFHPKAELVPALGGPRLPAKLDVRRAPAMRSRGVQMHLLHPIEYFKVLNEPGPENLEDAKRLVDWLVKTGQNHLQWTLLQTVPFEAWRPHARAIVEYAHLRGVKVGAVVQLWGGSSLQNAVVLVKHEAQWESEMDEEIARLTTIPWDVFELNLGEFIGKDAAAFLGWIDGYVARVAKARPDAEINVQNHVGNYASLYVDYQGQRTYYYHLPRYADPRLGQVVHTLSFFDLYRDWATYKHADFHFQREYIFEQLPTRRVKYLPESAYWVTADDDVPVFLPMYIFARYNDVHRLTADIRDRKLPALDGHVMFSSGHEWGYWMTDYLTAKMLWEPERPLSYFLDHYAAAYGTCASPVSDALGKIIDAQNRYLFDGRLVGYIQGEDAIIDLGFRAGFETHPERKRFEDVLNMPEGDRATFTRDVIGGLDAFASELEPLEADLGARCRGADAALAPWCDELWDGVAITRLRASHAARLYRAVTELAAGRDPEPSYRAALAVTDEAREVIARREKGYRFDLARLVDAYPNPTRYGFGYLRQAHTQCFWRRREEEVRYLLDNRVAAAATLLPSCQE